jgi:uncharacterized membrane protein
MQSSLKPPSSTTPARRGWPIQIHLSIYISALFLMLVLFTLGTAILPATEDVTAYYEYSRRIMMGLVPYKDFAIEYPPFALVFFLLPWLVLYPAGGLQGEFYDNRDFYASVFHVECFLLEVAVMLLAYRLLRKIYPEASPLSFTSRMIWYTLGALAISLYMMQRFDIGAAFLLLLGLYLLYDNKPGWAGVVLGLGTAAKLYPAIALPLALIYLWRYQSNHKGAWRCLVGFGMAGALVTLPFVLISPEGFLNFLKYHSDRGIQIETIFATIAALGHYLGLNPASSIVDHTSIGVASPWSKNLATLSTLLTVGGLLALYWLAWRKARPGNKLSTDWLVQATALVVLWFILANKVFSPQYMIWVLAFVPFWKGRKQTLVLLALLLSFVPFPLLAAELFKLDWKPMVVLIVRNGLLLALFVQLLSILRIPKTVESSQ